MVQHSASSKRAEDRLATRVSQSPPAGLVSGGIAILVMLLALGGVLPRPMFLVGAAGLIVVAYKLDKRFKVDAPPDAPSTDAASPEAASPDVASPRVPAAPEVSTTTPAASPAVPPPVAAAPAAAAPPPAAAAPLQPSAPPPSLLPITDLKAEHTRLTRELTDRVDDDEDVRFEKFMRLRRIEEEIERQQGAPPG